MGQLAPMKFFKFKHDKIVIMHLQGMKNFEIAQELGITPTRVYQVLKDPSAQMMIQRFRREMRKKAHSDIEGRMTELGVHAIENIALTIEAEAQAGSRFKKHQDDVSFKLLDRLGYTPRTDRAVDDGGLKIDRDLSERLVQALEQTQEVHAFDEAEEADWHLVEDEPREATG